jgi:hypothetical protein
MNQPLTSLHRFGAAVYHGAQNKKGSRPFIDIFGDRVRQAATEPTLMAFAQRLCDLVDVRPSALPSPTVSHVMAMANGPAGPGALRWVRENHTLFAVLCAAKHADADSALEHIVIASADAVNDVAPARKPYAIGIHAECLSPLAHGADRKSGNATLFRRMKVLGRGGALLDLPFYAGNALRGQLRDILADHFTTAMGLATHRDQPSYALWFFHALYAGGALEEQNGATAALAKQLGANGSVRSEGVRRFRELLPQMDLLGCAMGNRVLHGMVDVGDLRPVSSEWNNGGQRSTAELMEWLYLTRRDDHQGAEEHLGMIAVTETLRAGTVLEGGIDPRPFASELALSALGAALHEWKRLGRLGAQNRAGLGRVRVTLDNAPDPAAYEAHLSARKEEIMEYLRQIAAIDARR